MPHQPVGIYTRYLPIALHTPSPPFTAREDTILLLFLEMGKLECDWRLQKRQNKQCMASTSPRKLGLLEKDVEQAKAKSATALQGVSQSLDSNSKEVNQTFMYMQHRVGSTQMKTEG